jgi:hypothetical protein
MQLADNVIEFRPATRSTRPRKLTIAEARKSGRRTWEKALRAHWADQNNWEGDEIEIETGHSAKVTATIARVESGYWIWHLSWLGRVQLKSPWIYVRKETAIASALEAVVSVV